MYRSLKRKLFRGGSIDYIKNLDEIGNPQLVFNLRNGEDSNLDNLDYYHFLMSNKIEKYDTSQK
jgi:protein-tyrosine phosphatase